MSKRIVLFLGWILGWITLWALFGWLLPLNVHNPFVGFSAPVLVFFVIFNSPMFTWPIFLEMYLPFIVFWLVTLLIYFRFSWFTFRKE